MLGVAVLLLALATGASSGPAVLAFVVGTGVVAFAALADRRALLLRGDVGDLEPLPTDAVREPAWRVVAQAAFPSTFGVTVLAAIALAAGKGELAALLGGVVAGLGVASGVGLVALLAWEHERGARLHIGKSGRRFVSRG